MTQYLVEQMRSITRRLQELDTGTKPGLAPTSPPSSKSSSTGKDVMPTDPLKGSVNARQLADTLGISDLSTFQRAMNKVKQGRADRLSRQEMTEFAMSWVRLMELNPNDTRKVMQQMQRLQADPAEAMEEDAGSDSDHYEEGYQAGKDGQSRLDNPHDMDDPAFGEWEDGWKAGSKAGGHR